MIKELNAVNKRILIIPDTHFPYAHKDTHKFLKAVRDKYITPYDLVIHLGDEADKHAISFHNSDADLMSAGDEMKKAQALIKGLEEIFPKVYLCESNHGSLHIRRLKAAGIPIGYLKSYQQIYDTPKWEWHDDYLVKTGIGDIYICHGKSGAYGKLCREVGCSAIQGHFHGKFEISWFNSAIQQRFNMFAGCLIAMDGKEGMAFAYGKNHLPKPILGCALISKHGYPRLIKMGLNKAGKWDGKLP